MYKNFFNLITKFCNRSNISKIIIIFIVGFVSRVLVVHFYGVNVYLEYLDIISFIYYALMAMFIVVLGEIISYSEFNIIPSFILNSYILVIKVFINSFELFRDLLKSISYINSIIYAFIFTKDFNFKGVTINSIILFLRNLFYYLLSNLRDSTKLSIDNDDFESNTVKSNKANIPKIRNVFNKGSDSGEKLTPKVYKSTGSSSTKFVGGKGSSDIIDEDVSKSKLAAKRLGIKEEISDGDSFTPSKRSYKGSEVGFTSNLIKRGDDILLGRSDFSLDKEKGIDYRNSMPNTPNNTLNNLYDYYNQLPVQPDGPNPYSNLTTPSTMTPLFNEEGQYSQSIASNRSNVNSVTGSYSRRLSDNESYDYPTAPSNSPVTVDLPNRASLLGNIPARANSVSTNLNSNSLSSVNYYPRPLQYNPLGTRASTLQPVYSESNYSRSINGVQENTTDFSYRHASSLYYSQGIDGYGYRMEQSNNPNIYNQLKMGNLVPGTLFFDPETQRTYRVLPNMANNTENNTSDLIHPALRSQNNITTYPNDSTNPCSPNYTSNNPEALARTETLNKTSLEAQNGSVQEIVIKDDKLGKLKLGFKSLGGKFSNGASKIGSLYVHYEDVARRHIFWNLIEEGTGNFESYSEFKKSWDSKTKIWDEMKKKIKKDIKLEIEGLLGINGNKPAIGPSVTREIEDMVRDRRPFNRTGNNPTTNNSNINSSNTNEPQTSSIKESSKNSGHKYSKHHRLHKHRTRK